MIYNVLCRTAAEPLGDPASDPFWALPSLLRARRCNWWTRRRRRLQWGWAQLVQLGPRQPHRQTHDYVVQNTFSANACMAFTFSGASFHTPMTRSTRVTKVPLGGGRGHLHANVPSFLVQANKTRLTTPVVLFQMSIVSPSSPKKKIFLPQRSDDVCKYLRRQTRPQLKVAAISKIINCVPR